MTGEIPTELGSLTNLYSLNLRDNRLSGTIPADLGSLTILSYLNLASNQLSGTIPADLGSLTILEDLYISGNQLTGCIPDGLQGVVDLEGLALPFCPAAEGDCANDGAVMDAANRPGLVSDCAALLAMQNTLAGSATLNWSAELAIEDWAGVTVGGPPGRVTGLDLRYYQLSGTIPAELGRLTNLQVLDLSGNQLTGTIPGDLASLTNLQELRLSDNYQLTGCIPDGLEDVPSNDLEGLGLRFCSDPTGDCATDGAVTDAANNPGLVSDCTALLAARTRWRRTHR